jgi:hypothetical protein
MKASLWYKVFVLCIGLAYSGLSFSQGQYPFTAFIEKTNKTGAHRIDLTPEIISRAMRNLADIRIIDENKTQVPYIIRSELPVFRENNFLELKIASVKKAADKQTHIEIENPTARITSALFLVVRNNEAYRTVSISGSDDRSGWYVIRENVPLNRISSASADRYIQVLEFPKSSYRYFDITINGKNLLPVNIIKVGTYEDLLRSGKFMINPSPVLNQKDSGKYSYIYTRFKNAYRTDELEIRLSGARYFQRSCTIVEKQRGLEVARQNVVLRSDNANRFTTYFKSSELELIIENEDNPPLRVDSIRSFQLNQYLFAYLDSAKTYQLGFGDSLLKAPVYDINYFKDSLINNVIVAGTGEIKSNNISSPEVGHKKSVFGETQLWLVIGAVLLFLLYLTVRMAKEVNKKN